MKKNITFEITEELKNLRLDKALSNQPEIGSRGKAMTLIKNLDVLVNNKTEKPSYSVQLGDVITAEIPLAPTSDAIKPYDFKLDILFEDQDIIVLNKPSGLVMHPSAGHEDDTLVNALVHHAKDLSMGFGEKRPGIVHRLDKDTSGVLVIAKNDKSHMYLSKQFKDRTVQRVYYAIVYGYPKNDEFTLESYLKRHPGNRKKYASELILEGKEPTGKKAITHIKTIQRFVNGLSLIECKLETGRTHQIRIHVSEQTNPIVGDDVYGSANRSKNLKSVALRNQIKALDRIALHAAKLAFVHPTTGKTMMYTVPWPKELEFALPKEFDVSFI